MKFRQLIAESGGTKTDWCGVDFDQQLHRFTTESYHPQRVVDTTFLQRQREFWKHYDLNECFLHFYGAGCLREENQQKMKTALKSFGFSEILVESDLFAAARAVGEQDAMIAICGTGSVLFKIEYDQLTELRGGTGWEKGDEGSGFYFGKLLVSRLMENNGQYPEIRQIVEQWNSLKELEDSYNTPASKELYSQLPRLFTAHQSHPLIAGIHLENVHLFLELYAHECDAIGFVGSYAFYMQDFFRLACTQRNIRPVTFIERPIDVIIKKTYLIN
ncbi:MAG: hypothetical protein KF704_03460 [Crocinitomicaceae bacterium]|nr:hypothetical protein [Crocinitomicaceae bacterium]